MHGRIVSDPDFERVYHIGPASSRLHKRNKRSDDYFKEDEHPMYDSASNRIPGHRISTRHHIHRILQPDSSATPFFVQFDQDHVEVTPLPPHSDHRMKLFKRSYVGDLTRKFKTAIQHGKEWSDVTFVHVTKSLFNLSALRNSSRTYLKEVHESVSDASKMSILLAHDIISMMPFGDMANSRLGIDELAQNVTMSDAVLVTPFTYGLDVLILGPKEATRMLVTSIKHISAILVGILKKVGLLVKDIFQYVKSLFNWDDVLMNHRILSVHYGKMLNFVKTYVTGGQNNFTQDLRSTLERIGDVTEQATSLFVQGNLTSLADLIAVANKEIYRNMTEAPKLSSTVPQDVQSSFMTDRMASNIKDVQVQISDQDQESALELTKQTLQSVTGLAQDAGSAIWNEMKLLAAELSKQNWNMQAILPILVKLFRFSVQLVVEKVVQGVLTVIDFLLTLINRILSAEVKIPFLSSFYETVITRGQGSKLTFYDLFSLNAVLPVTIWFKAFNHGQNLFTEQESMVLLATENPEYYIDNLVLFAMQVPNRNATKLRSMYRQSVSYLIGSGYAAGQMMAGLVGFTPLGMTSVLGLYILRAPFEVLSIMCNYPWSWYTETVTKVGMNIR